MYIYICIYIRIYIYICIYIYTQLDGDKCDSGTTEVFHLEGSPIMGWIKFS